MGIQFWIWVIIIIIILITRANKKKDVQSSDAEEASGRPKSRRPKVVTFEDLLREIQGEKVIQAAPTVKKEKEYEHVNYDDNIPDEINDLEDVDYDFSKDDKVVESREAAKMSAKESPTITEVTTLQDSIVQMKPYRGKGKDHRRKSSLGFIEQLKNPDGFKKAFIMSEILRRKY